MFNWVCGSSHHEMIKLNLEDEVLQMQVEPQETMKGKVGGTLTLR